MGGGRERQTCDWGSQSREELRGWAEGAREGRCIQTEVLELDSAVYSSSDISIGTHCQILSHRSPRRILQLRSARFTEAATEGSGI